MTRAEPALPAPRLVVVIPALNEAAALGRVLEGIRAAQRDPAPVAVIVGDNGSSDGTADVARRHGALVVHEPRRGYGSACLKALAAARELPGGPPDVVCFVDADYSDYPEDMPAVVGPALRDEVDLVIGSRTLLPASRRALLPQARFGNQLATGLIRLLWGARFSDLGPFRAVRWEALERVEMRDPDFGWTVELQLKAARLGLRHCEVPVRYRERIGTSKITGTLQGSYRAGVTILRTIARHALEARLERLHER